jgi:1-acyl-sn-glycerol-3-phosphate acyltransferase
VTHRSLAPRVAVLAIERVNKSAISQAALRMAGWRFEGPVPSEKKYVALALPHTSNWDGLLLLMLAQTIDLRMRWMIKASALKGAHGALLRALGAVAIDRSQATNMVDQMVELFQANDEFVLVIPPEGTRARADYWKSGFYHIARGANVPVAPTYLDYGRKRAGIGAPIAMTGDMRKDMDAIRAFYSAKDPKPFDAASYGPIRLREES